MTSYVGSIGAPTAQLTGLDLAVSASTFSRFANALRALTWAFAPTWRGKMTMVSLR